MADVIVVLGMHRSGTSAIAGVLTKLGATAPKTLMPATAHNAKGYFESTPFMALHDELLTSAGSHWHDWRLLNPEWYKSPAAKIFKQRAKDLFASEFDGAILPVFKDPRVCRFFPFWLEVFHDIQLIPHIVMPVRSPLEAARSLRDAQGIPLAEGLLLWLRHYLDAEAHSRTEKRSILTLNDLQSDWRKTCEKIAIDTDLSWPRLSDRSAHDIENFLSKDLLHHQTDYAEIAAHSDVHEWTLRAYEALLELARNPFSNSAMDTLDQIRAVFNQSSKMFGRILVDYEIGIEDLRVQTHGLVSERDALLQHENEFQTQHAATFAEFSGRIEQAEQARSEAVREQESLSHAHAQTLAELDSLRQDFHQSSDRESKTLAALETLQSERDTLIGSLTEAQASALAFKEQSERDSAELQKSIAELDALRQDLHQSSERECKTVAALEILRSERDTLIGFLAEAQASTLAFKEQSERDSAELQKSIAEVTSLLRQRDAEKGDMLLKLERHVAELKSMNSTRIDAERSVQDLTVQLASSQREKNALQLTLIDISSSLQKANEASDEAHGKLEQLSSDLNTTKEELSKSDQKKTALAAEYEILSASHQKAIEERQELATHLQHNLSELQRVKDASQDHAAKQASIHAQVLNSAAKTHAAQMDALRAKLVDAEAALSHISAQRPSKVWAKLLPDSVRQRLIVRRLLRTGLFDSEWYLKTYGDIAKNGLSPPQHYLEHGFHQGYWPNPFFDTRWYLDRYDDARRAGINPLIHYALHGWHEGRDPSPNFQTDFYLENNPDVRKTGVNPLAHYLRHGRHEGRLPMRPPNRND